MLRQSTFPRWGKLNRLLPPCHLGALIEKSHTIETARCIYAPAHLPAVAHRREIPRGKNENKRTRIPPNACTHITLRHPERSAKRVVVKISRERNENKRTRIPQNTCPRRLIACKQEGDGFVEKPRQNEKPRGRHGFVKVVLTWV